MLKKWEKYQADQVLKGNDENGNRLVSSFARDYRIVMGVDLCLSCSSFGEKFKNFIKKLETMSKNPVKNSGFVIKKMFENITLHGSRKYYNNANLSDDDALELLEKHPKGEGLFDRLPENLEEIKAKSIEVNEEIEGVLISGKEFSVAETIELLKKAGIQTKSTTKKGLEKALHEASGEEIQELEKLVTF